MTTHKDILSFGDHGSTFGGNYLSTRAGLAVLEVLSALYKEGKIEKTVIYFEEKLKNILQNIQAEVLLQSMKAGLIVLKAGRNTVRFLPSITISQTEIDEGFSRFEEALKRIELWVLNIYL